MNSAQGKRNNRLRLLFIAGYGRSGSTLVERSIGQLQGYNAAGEICHIWERGFIENQLCGCSKPFSVCPFWKGIADAASISKAEAREYKLAARKVSRPQHLPLLLLPKLRSRKFQSTLDFYLGGLAKLYNGIAQCVGHEIVIDSSKDPVHGLLLGMLPQIDLRILHVVRDSRAVAHSWMRKKVRPEIQDGQSYMPVFSPTRSSLVWDVKNLLCERLGDSAHKYFRVRYEDVISNPQATIEAICQGLECGLPPDGVKHVSGDVIELGLDHTCAGNPMRFNSGTVTLKLDAEWELKMPSAIRMYITALTYPWLRRYGYSSQIDRSNQL